MNQHFTRSLVASAAASTLGLGCLVSAANAEDAGTGGYASSVATDTYVNIANLPGSAVQFRAQVVPTSSAVTTLNGKVTIEFRRNASGNLAAKRTIDVSGTPNTVRTLFVDLPESIPSGSFTIFGVFVPEANQLEKASYHARVVTYNKK